MICDSEPDAAPSDVEPAIASALPGEVPDLWQQAGNAVRHLSGLPVRVGQEVIDGARHALSSRAPSDDEPVEQKRVPVAGFNCAISSDRGFVYGSLPLAEIKALKDHFGVTVNDVVLSLVAGSLRTYLLKRGELPEDSLRCGFAVSLRSRDDEEFSNRVTTASATLATTVADPVERLRVITDEAEAAKKVARSGGKGFLELVGILPPLAVGPLLSMAPATVLPRIAGYNLLVSSLRGSPIQLYMGGARVTAMYPMSIIVPGGGLDVTCMSYTDHIDFGLTLEPSALPDPWNIISGLEESLSEYMALLP